MVAEAPVAAPPRSIDDDAFAAAMGRFAPFEAEPVLAAAVSGGPDSMALALLAQRWAARLGGRVFGLVVDHGLRPGAAAEAREAAAWLSAAGVAPTILRWTGRKPAHGIQAAAREARYALIEAWCAEAGVLHLLTGHHRDDQRETAIHRAARGSGPAGLAGMSAVVERPGLRILRPLLGTGKARLIAYLEARGQGWVDDPSNRDPRFARARIRARGPKAAPALDAAGAERAAREHAAAACLAAAVRLDPAGFARLDPAALCAHDSAVMRAALGALVRTIGGRDYPPRRDRLERLARAIEAGEMGGGRTLAGCRIVPRRGGLLVFREPRAIAAAAPAGPDPALWDGRFRVVASAPGAWMVHALGSARPEAAAAAVPPAVRPSLPALSDAAGLAAVPHLGWCRADVEGGAISLRFAPRWALAGAPFVSAGLDVVSSAP